MFRNSAKLRLADGVAIPKPAKGAPPPPGVDIMDDGRGVDFGGGVEGARMRGLAVPACAGEGEVARYIRRLASSCPVGPSRAAVVKPFWRRRAERATPGGGVRGARGGDGRMCEPLNWKEVIGKSSSSSSERRGDRDSSGMVELSDTKDKLGLCVRGNRACRL